MQAAPGSLAMLQTSALLLDRGVAEAKIARMRRHMAAAAGVRFRPHLETAMSLAAAEMLFDGANGPITVSTLREAEVFGAPGHRDVLHTGGIG